RSVASVSRLAGGVLIGPLPMTRAEHVAFADGTMSALPASMSVVIDSPNAWGFAADIRIAFEAHTLTSPAADAVAASVVPGAADEGPWGSGVWPTPPPGGQPDTPSGGAPCTSGTVDRVWQEDDGQ